MYCATNTKRSCEFLNEYRDSGRYLGCVSTKCDPLISSPIYAILIYLIIANSLI